METHIDIRWLLERQEDLLGRELAVQDYSGLVAAVARHRVNTPHLDDGSPDAYWQAAAILETIVLLRPLPVRNEFFGHGVCIAYIGACGETIQAPEDKWWELIDDIRALRVHVFEVAARLRSWQSGS